MEDTYESSMEPSRASLAEQGRTQVTDADNNNEQLRHKQQALNTHNQNQVAEPCQPAPTTTTATTWLASLTSWLSSATIATSHRLINQPTIRGTATKSILVQILLPLLFILLLPSIKIYHRGQPAASSVPAGSSQLLLGLLRLPLDQVRLEASLIGLASGASASRQDLLEEETHLQLINPGASQEMGAMQRMQHHLHTAADRGAAVYVTPPIGGMETEHLAAASEYGATSLGAADQGSVDPVGSIDGSVAQAGVSDGTFASSVIQARVDLPSVRALNVKCEKNYMTVNIVFDRPFYGTVFSKGHYNDQQCVHLPANSGQSSINFDIHLGKCGMTKSDASGQLLQPFQQQQQQPAGPQQPNGLYIENTIIIQYDPQVQEIYDQARRLRCTWYDYYEKSVSFRPYNVDMLDAVTANFLGDNIQCWMQIQVGKGPWSSEVAGIVKIGQTMTMVLAIKDDDNKFDMLVRNCVAHDGKHQPIQLVDEYGCVARPKIMARFQKIRNFGPTATVVSYAHFQAFKFPDSMSVHFQCVIQVCRSECPEPVCSGQASGNELTSSGPAALTATDYATSGTEIMPSKEMFPTGPFFLTNHSQHGVPQASQSAIHLKMDGGQGRAQVKLDTSIMAGNQRGGSNLAGGGGGPLPPHLLHVNSELSGGPPYASQSGYYKPQLGQARIASSNLLASHSAPASMMMSGIRTAPQQQVAPAGGRAQTQFSSPYSLHRKQQLFQQRSSIVADSLEGGTGAPDNQLGPQPPEEGAQALSLIAKPRGLRHRHRRSPDANETAAPPPADPKWLDRRMRSPPPAADSTAVKTQKTIQVVSPDDVAFNLLELEPTTSFRTRDLSSTTAPSLVCFSMARLVVSGFVTLAALAMTVMIVCYVLLRQRILTFGAHSKGCASPASVFATDDDCQNQNQELMLGLPVGSLNQINKYPARLLEAGIIAQQQQQQQQQRRRQQDEIQQRNKYLNRLYSQFVPASYWR